MSSTFSNYFFPLQKSTETLEGHTASVLCMKVNGDRVASGSLAGEVRTHPMTCGQNAYARRQKTCEDEENVHHEKDIPVDKAFGKMTSRRICMRMEIRYIQINA